MMFQKLFLLCAVFATFRRNCNSLRPEKRNDGREKRQVTTVGKVCEHSTDCGKGSYCGSNKLCACLSSFVDIDSYCWPKVNPGEAGCTSSRQCEATWPGASCFHGECRCANNQPAFHTKDGTICLNYGYCPLGGESPKYRTDDGIMECPHGIDEICPNGYDCICSKPDCDSDKGSNTFCCPSRALTCTMGMDQGTAPGSGGTTIEKFYFNSVTGECEPFAYRGAKGNANNFETREHCQSYCTQTCPRGQPEYDQAVYPKIKKTVKYCTSLSTGCNSNYQCQVVGTSDYCCPKPNYICSRRGGMEYDVLPISGFDIGVATDPLSTMSFSRYYYDEVQQRCLPFKYLGQAGNYNNFLSEAHCDSFCSKIVCDVGEPLKDTTGVRNVQCTTTNACPASHECKNSVCCPTKETTCKLARAIGTCGKYVDKWWFDAETGNCVQFTYSGCQGNANNFETFKECSKFCRDTSVEPLCTQGTAKRDNYGKFIVCDGKKGDVQRCPVKYYCYYDGKSYGCCPTQSLTCELKPDAGTKCGPTVLRWFYDTKKRSCTTFDYNGCDGNSNNFPMQRDCNDYCRVESCPDGGEPLKNGNGMPRVCQTSSQCPNTHYCTPISQRTNRGVHHSSNCCPKKDHVCSRYMDSGVRCSSSTITRYWFNPIQKTCNKFNYNGCDGNLNNFSTKKACENYCMSSACQPGAIVYNDQNTGILANCNLGNTYSDGCPTGFGCEKSELLGQNVCCGGKKEYTKLCPSGSRPFIDAQSQQPMQCTPNVDVSCPGGYYCWYSNAVDVMSGYYCCLKVDNRTAQLQPDLLAEEDEGVCPPKLYPVRTGEGVYKSCSPTAPPTDLVHACGPGMTCQWSDKETLYICCSRVKAKKPYLPPAPPTKPYVPLPAVVTTPKPSVCPPMPPNLTPLMQGSDYRRCSPQAISQQQGGCPSSAYCLYADSLGKYICCAGGPPLHPTNPPFPGPAAPRPVRPANPHPFPPVLPVRHIPSIKSPNLTNPQLPNPIPFPNSPRQPPTAGVPQVPKQPNPALTHSARPIQGINPRAQSRSSLQGTNRQGVRSQIPVQPLPVIQIERSPQVSRQTVNAQKQSKKTPSTSRSSTNQNGQGSGLSSKECSEAPGFLPIKDPEGHFQYCSPMTDTACKEFENPNITISRCLYSSVQMRYLCCQSAISYVLHQQ